MLLLDKIKHYEEIYDYEITPGLPIIARANGRHFSKITRNIVKPYSPELGNILQNTMLYSAMEIEGAVFGYQYNDEVSFLLHSEDAYNNKIQKIISVVAGLTSLNFIKNLFASDDPPDLIGEALFDCTVFPLPSLEEASNYFILKQKECRSVAIANAAESELTKIHGNKQAEGILFKKKTTEKLEILEECGIIFNETYPKEFHAGACVYKVPRLVRTKSGDINRKKWVLDVDVPIFAIDKNFLMNIFMSGCDVFRAERDLIIRD